jgi:predicted amidohydrolase
VVGSVTLVAACQIAPVVGDVIESRARVRSAVEEAAEQAADLVVLPELAQSGYVFKDLQEARSVAEHLDGPSVREWTDLSRRLQLVLVAGFCERGPDGHLFNSCVLIDHGQVRATYRKAHLWDRESEFFSRGHEGPPVVDTSIGRVAMMVCYDVEFPEWTRMAGLGGADVLAVPTNWPLEARPELERPMEVVRLQAAASANRMFVVAADRCGVERGVAWVGGSVVLGPDGYPLAGPVAADREQLLTARVNLREARTKTISPSNHVLTDRRPELYALLTRAHEEPTASS